MIRVEQKKIDEIRERCDSATPGPWFYNCGQDVYQSSYCIKNKNNLIIGLDGGLCVNNAIFITRAREDVPYLLGEVERLTVELKAHEEKDKCGQWFDAVQLAKIAMNLMKVKEFEQAAEAGRLVTLPCKSGDTIYAVNSHSRKIIECSVDYIELEDEMIIHISYDSNEVCYECEGCPFSSWAQNSPDCDYSCGGECGMFVIKTSDFGKLFHLKHEAAETALAQPTDITGTEPVDDVRKVDNDNTVAEPTQPVKLVVLETPYAGDVEENIKYARACIRDCLMRGEAPIASHLLYTQPGILDDNVPEERRQGIAAGLAWLKVADKSVVYTDKGISSGVQGGIDAAKAAGVPVEYRRLHTNAEKS